MTYTLLRLMIAPIQRAVAQGSMTPVFDGPGLEGGLEAAADGTELPSGDPRDVIVRALEVILNFAALIAVIMIIIAGFILVLSFGSEENKDRAKRIIYYTLIGLVVILFARLLVELVTVFLAGQL